MSLWFVYLRYMLPKRLQSEMIKQWVYGKCIPQVYAIQEVTKWNGDTVSLWFVYLRYMLPKRLQSEMVTQWIYGLYTSGICYPRDYKVKWLNSEFMVNVYLRYMLPKRLQSEMMTQWGCVYLSGPIYWFCELMLWFHNSLVNLDLRVI